MNKMATNMAVNPDLQNERDGASFDSEKMTNFLYGGPEKVKRRRTVESLFLNDPDYQHEDLNFLSREQRYETLLKRTLLMVTKMKELKLNEEDQRFYGFTLMIKDTPPLTMHSILFIPTLRAQATDEQKSKWLKMAENYAIIGTYAQTEMGHGTYVEGLETTATFDPKTQEFILNTPTLTAAKWWPADMGKTANHVLLMAQLRIHGKSYGPHLFMVQIRSMEDHKPLPGITVGDIGPKFGNSVDNGFLMLDNVRIPRENMLMKNSKVEPDGTYVKPSNPKLAYGTMVHARTVLVNGAAIPMAMAATIAIRYSCVRRQSVVKPGYHEAQILDYVTQQYKLFPHLAATYAFWLTGQTMQAVYEESLEQMSKGNISVLSELHALSAGLKALTTWTGVSGIEECRLACGGHGYSHASGLPRLYADMSPTVTLEGEKTVLMLQTARYLMASYNRALQGKKLVGTVAYLSDVPPVLPEAGRDKNLLDMEVLCDAYRHRAARLIQDASAQLMSEMKSGKDQPDAWNATSVDLVRAATAHSQYLVVKNFAERLTDPTLDSSISDILARLCQLHALHGLMNNSGDFLEDGYMTGKDIRQVRRHVTSIMAKLRPDAVALVDAFDIPDGFLKSILGRYDGNVYQHLLKWAKASPLNKTDVHKSYHKYLKPFLQANKAKL